MRTEGTPNSYLGGVWPIAKPANANRSSADGMGFKTTYPRRIYHGCSAIALSAMRSILFVRVRGNASTNVTSTGRLYLTRFSLQ